LDEQAGSSFQENDTPAHNASANIEKSMRFVELLKLVGYPKD
jgi:hypothetical protein